MSQSYRRLCCKLTCAGEREGEHDDKKRSSRSIRRANKIKTKSLLSVHGDDTTPTYRTKKDIEVYSFIGDGKTFVDPERPGSFYVKKLGKNKLRMVK